MKFPTLLRHLKHFGETCAIWFPKNAWEANRRLWIQMGSPGRRGRPMGLSGRSMGKRAPRFCDVPDKQPRHWATSTIARIWSKKTGSAMHHMMFWHALQSLLPRLAGNRKLWTQFHRLKDALFMHNQRRIQVFLRCSSDTPWNPDWCLY